MRFRHVMILSGFFLVACKTASRGSQPEAPVPTAVQPTEEAPPPVPPSALESSPDLVTPGPDEVLVRRGAGARCPSNFELEEIEQAVQALGRETINLVGEDLASIRKTSTRTDRDGITSCCNQLEQLVQDVEIMNEDKAGTVPSVDRIRRLTVQLCPAG